MGGLVHTHHSEERLDLISDSRLWKLRGSEFRLKVSIKVMVKAHLQAVFANLEKHWCYIQVDGVGKVGIHLL